MEEKSRETADNAKALDDPSPPGDISLPVSEPEEASNMGETSCTSATSSARSASDTSNTTGSTGSSGFGAFKSFVSPGWWKNSSRSTFLYAPKCVVPAGMFTLAGLILIGTLDALKDKLMAAQGSLQLTDLLLTMFVFMGGACIAIALIIMSFGTWIVRLTSYCRFILQTGVAGDFDALSRSDIIKRQDESLVYVRQRKAYLSILFLFVTLYMALPCLFVVGWLLILSLPATMPSLSLPALPAPLNILITATAIAMSVVLSVVSFVALAVGGVSTRPPRQAASQSLSLSCKFLVPLALTVCVSLVLITLISAPETFTQLAHPEEALTKAPSNLALETIETIWQGITSVILFPIFAGAICEVLRGRIE